MKNVLIIGGAGCIGRNLIKYLLSEGKYDITVLDLKSKNNYKKLRRYKKRIRIMYYDMNDVSVIDSLVKENLIIIYLAGNLPSMVNLNDELFINNEYASIKMIVNSIKKYNPQCYFMYGSSTSVYGDKVINDTRENKNVEDIYSKYKIKCEKVIVKYLKNYTIFRIPYVLGDIAKDNIIYNVSLNSNIETIMVENLSNCLVSAIDNKKSLNRKIVNVSSGESFRVLYKDLLIKYLDNYGLTFNMLINLLFYEKNYNSAYIEDDSLNKLLDYRSNNIKYYFNNLEDYKSKVNRLLPRLLALPIKWFIKMKK